VVLKFKIEPAVVVGTSAYGAKLSDNRFTGNEPPVKKNESALCAFHMTANADTLDKLGCMQSDMLSLPKNNSLALGTQLSNNQSMAIL
jgi:hypothetical protein